MELNFFSFSIGILVGILISGFMQLIVAYSRKNRADREFKRANKRLEDIKDILKKEQK